MSDQENLLHHSYDGIQEYDNPLPGWWVYLFWASVLFSGGYYLYYHAGMGPSIEDEFLSEADAYYSAQAAQFEGIEIDEAFLYFELAQDPNRMGGAAGKFKANCVTCHGEGGVGLTGPNLTDGHWIHGGNLTDIYEIIRDGVKGKEMQPWLDKLGPYGVMAMAAYVGTQLRGTNQAGRAPEGLPFEWSPPAPRPASPAPSGPSEEPAAE